MAMIGWWYTLQNWIKACQQDESIISKFCLIAIIDKCINPLTADEQEEQPSPRSIMKKMLNMMKKQASKQHMIYLLTRTTTTTS